MNTISIRRGETEQIDAVVSDGEEASTATLIVKKQVSDLSPIIIKTSSFIDNKAFIEISEFDTLIPVDKYKYQITIVYEDGAIKKFPKPGVCDNGCGDNNCDCDFPIFEICDALDEPVVS